MCYNIDSTVIKCENRRGAKTLVTGYLSREITRVAPTVFTSGEYTGWLFACKYVPTTPKTAGFRTYTHIFNGKRKLPSHQVVFACSFEKETLIFYKIGWSHMLSNAYSFLFCIYHRITMITRTLCMFPQLSKTLYLEYVTLFLLKLWYDVHFPSMNTNELSTSLANSFLILSYLTVFLALLASI